ncbi:deazapurine DNA modification protein DpdA family protein [Nonomuraea africana]|uniref:deazapurine DNA modification protein DpdA family protein n=1 Tax=Nonomuraea africana TaxID=46171 RepID=UPI00340737DB
MKFYLGTHQPSWLTRMPGVPLMLSHRRLASMRRLPIAVTRWALDSGGFTELSLHGGWTTDPVVYGIAVRRYQQEIGNLDWAAPQDWMCEPHMLRRTGRTVGEHQRLTVQNYLRLREQGVPVIPVLQLSPVAQLFSSMSSTSAADHALSSSIHCYQRVFFDEKERLPWRTARWCDRLMGGARGLCWIGVTGRWRRSKSGWKRIVRSGPRTRCARTPPR